nr:hypothetical protein [uncultured Flavobacterium sp.]
MTLNFQHTEKIKILETIFETGSGKGYKVNYCIDPEDGQTIVWYAGEGGPIIKGKSEEVKAKFLEAMMLAESVYKLRYFAKHGRFPTSV